MPLLRLPLLATLAAVGLLSACASPPGTELVIRAGADMRCMQQESGAAGPQKVTTRWCSSRQIFQPNRHIVKVNGQTVFDGNDRDDVRAQARVGTATASVACTPRIEILDLRSEKSVALAALPKELVQACRIVADDAGFHRPFLRDAQCSQVYGAAVGPMVGRTLPFKRTQECQVTLDGATVFSASFVYQ